MKNQNVFTYLNLKQDSHGSQNLKFNTFNGEKSK